MALELSRPWWRKGHERLGAYPRLMRELFAVDGRAFAVGYRGVEEILAGGTRLMELPIRGACALSGRAADDLIAIGDGVARFDGSAWRKLDAADGEELLCVARHGDVFYAAGKRGRVARIDGDAVDVRVVEALGKITDIAVDANGRLSLVGRQHVAEGPFEALVARPASAVSVAHFRGRQYWGAVGDEDAMGLFIGHPGQDAGESASERVSPLMAFGLATDGEHLYGGGEFEVFRFDGERFETLQIAYDDDASRWELGPLR